MSTFPVQVDTSAREVNLRRRKGMKELQFTREKVIWGYENNFKDFSEYTLLSDSISIYLQENTEIERMTLFIHLYSLFWL